MKELANSAPYATIKQTHHRAHETTAAAFALPMNPFLL